MPQYIQNPEALMQYLNTSSKSDKCTCMFGLIFEFHSESVRNKIKEVHEHLKLSVHFNVWNEFTDILKYPFEASIYYVTSRINAKLYPYQP